MIDEIWASLQEDNARVSQEVKKKKQTLAKPGITLEKAVRPQSQQAEVITLLSSLGLTAPLPPSAPAAAASKKKKSDKKKSATGLTVTTARTATAGSGSVGSASAVPREPEGESASEAATGGPQQGKATAAAMMTTITSQDLLTLLGRDLTALQDEHANLRRKALKNIYQKAFQDHQLSEDDYSIVFREIAKMIFKRMADSQEGCREEAQRLLSAFFTVTKDLVPILGYYFPCLLQRIPNDQFGYDESMQIFVSDRLAHEAYKRGRAVQRQDKVLLSTSTITTVQSIEGSEEVRLLALQALKALIHRVIRLQSAPILHPYFEDILRYLQAHVMDSFPGVQMTICEILILLCHEEDYELGLKYYAIALVRLLLPLLRHKLAKVRNIVLQTLISLYHIRDHSKRKSAASETILDLVGFREENVIPIAAFYDSSECISFNYLAELVNDSSIQVRGESLLTLLEKLLTMIEDRRDYETRLLPYLLDLLTDPVDSIAQRAYRILSFCGEQYENDHQEEILQQKQYAVDGASHLHLLSSWPRPFERRPSIGMRLFVRGNTRRFLSALLNELSHWQLRPRAQAISLLITLTVLCEESLTMEAHHLLPTIITAYHQTQQDNHNHLYDSNALQFLLLSLLLGRYLPPDLYMYYLLPRLSNDMSVSTYGYDLNYRCHVLHLLVAFIHGSQPSLLIPHFHHLCKTLTNAAVGYWDSPVFLSTISTVLLVLLQVIVLPESSASSTTSYNVLASISCLDSVDLFTAFVQTLLHPARQAVKEQQQQQQLSILSSTINNAHNRVLATSFQATGRISIHDLNDSFSMLLRFFLTVSSGSSGGGSGSSMMMMALSLMVPLAPPSQSVDLLTFLGKQASHLFEKAYLIQTFVQGDRLVVSPLTNNNNKLDGISSSSTTLEDGIVPYELCSDWNEKATDFILLTRLVPITLATSPLLAIQQQVLSYFVVLCSSLLQCSTSIHNDYSTLLYKHLQLLEIVLIPWIYQLSRYDFLRETKQLLLLLLEEEEDVDFSVLLTSSQQSAEIVIPWNEESKRFLLQTIIPSVMVLISSSRLSLSPSLQNIRLRLLALLTAYHHHPNTTLSSWCTTTTTAAAAAVTTGDDDSRIEESMEVSLKATTCDFFLKERAGGQNLRGLITSLLSSSSSSSPQNKVNSLGLLMHLAELIKGRIGLDDRVRPFAAIWKQSATTTTSTTSTTESVSVSNKLLLLLKGKIAFYPALKSLMLLLYDSNDAVREATVQTFTSLVSLVFSHQEMQTLSSLVGGGTASVDIENGVVSEEIMLAAVHRLTQDFAAATTTATTATTSRSNDEKDGVVVDGKGGMVFKEVVNGLLSHSLSEVKKTIVVATTATAGVSTAATIAGNSDYLDSLDVLLRLLAVLDPMTFESCLRDHLHQLDDDHDDDGDHPEAVRDFLQGLLNHVDVLSSLPN